MLTASTGEEMADVTGTPGLGCLTLSRASERSGPTPWLTRLDFKQDQKDLLNNIVMNYYTIMCSLWLSKCIQICHLDSEIFLILSGDIINVKQVIIGPVIFSALSLTPDSSDESNFHICHQPYPKTWLGDVFLLSGNPDFDTNPLWACNYPKFCSIVYAIT